MLPVGSETTVDNLGDDIVNLSNLDDIAAGIMNEPSETSTIRAPEIIVKDDAPATPKRSSAALLPVTPRQGAAEKDGLASVPCTPVISESARSPTAGPVETGPEEVYYFTDNGWDWDEPNEKDGNGPRKKNQLLAPASVPAASKYVHGTTKQEPDRGQRSPLVLGIHNWDLMQLVKPPKATTTAKDPLLLPARTSPDRRHGNMIIEHPSEQEDQSTFRFVPSQQMAKSMQQAILDAGDCVPADVPDSEKTDTMDSDGYVPPDAQYQSGSRAKPEAPTEIGVCEAPSFSHPVANAEAPGPKKGRRNALSAEGTTVVKKKKPRRGEDDLSWKWNLGLKGIDNMGVIR
ncbi:hypothetical protein PGQ11_002841 [Apiospora arundinis]|uniref:Uncharacterized protein n=1 Tax=Apiospora arundinis TaxID=335852 RepID=A0ABR2J3V2_9PEZI